MDKISDADLWETRAMEHEFNALKARAEAGLARFQTQLDGVWTKYGLKKGEDQILQDGTIQRTPPVPVEPAAEFKGE